MAIVGSLTPKSSPMCDPPSEKPLLNSWGKGCCLLFMWRQKYKQKLLLVGLVGFFHYLLSGVYVPHRHYCWWLTYFWWHLLVIWLLPTSPSSCKIKSALVTKPVSWATYGEQHHNSGRGVAKSLRNLHFSLTHLSLHFSPLRQELVLQGAPRIPAYCQP